MRLTTRTSIAMRALMFCAMHRGEVVRKADIAVACNASLHHMAQVIHLLGRHGLLLTARGRGGGVMLGHAPRDISVGQVVRRLESDLPFIECADTRTNTCPLIEGCRLRGGFARALEAFYAALDEISLHDLVQGNGALARTLELEPA